VQHVTALEQPAGRAQAAPLLAAALAYLDRGWYVLPCRVRQKANGAGELVKDVQIIRHWRQASSNDPAVIIGWFGLGGSWADGSIAIDTGKSGLVVVDLDRSGDKRGPEVWAELGGPMAEHVVITPSDGAHLYYAADPDRPVGIDSRGKVGHGVDIRGDGGFVIAPPSSDWRGSYRETEIANWAHLTTVPGIVAERVPLGAPPRAAPVSPEPAHSVPPRDPSGLTRFQEAPGTPRYTPQQASARVAERLRMVMATPEGSGFNHALNEAAFELGHWVGVLDGIDENTARALLEEATRAVFPGGPDGDDVATIDSGLHGGMAKPYALFTPVSAQILSAAGSGAPGADDQFELEVQREYLRLKARRIAAERLAAENVTGNGDGAVDWDLLDQPPKPVEWVVPGLLARGRSYSLVGGPKSGKSYTARNMAVQAAESGYRVGFLDRENTWEGDWLPCLRSWGVTKSISERLDVRCFPAIPALDTEAGSVALLAYVQEHGIQVLLLDMLMRFLGGPENDSDTFNAYDRYTGQKLKAAGVTVIRLDHTGHDESSRARGSSGKAGDVDVQWMLARTETGLVTLDPGRISRHADQRDPVKLRQDGGRLRPVAPEAVAEIEPDADQELVTAFQEMWDSGTVTEKTRTATWTEYLQARGKARRKDVMLRAWRECLRRNGAAGADPPPKLTPLGTPIPGS
jgi:hypothetical protein